MKKLPETCPFCGRDTENAHPTKEERELRSFGLHVIACIPEGRRDTNYVQHRFYTKTPR